MPTEPTQCSDCAIIGGGPGGLTAALYLARFNRQVVLFDVGEQRMRWSPRNRNYPGFPDGLSGPDILKRFQEQASRFHVTAIPSRVVSVRRRDEGFQVEAEGVTVDVRRLILATGITDIWPQFQGAEELLGTAIRVCPICDAYETNGKRVGILGSGDRVAREALYLTKFTSRVVLFTHGHQEADAISDKLKEMLREASVAVVPIEIRRVEPGSDAGPPTISDETDRAMDGETAGGVTVILADGCREPLDLLFSALGVKPNNSLALELGADLDEEGYVITDRWQQTSVPGLYAIGDLTFEINQVAVAVGQAAIAATAVHNGLLEF